MQRQTTVQVPLRQPGRSSKSALMRPGKFWWWIGVIGLFLCLATVTRFLLSDHHTASVQDYVHIVIVGADQKGSTATYNYEPARGTAPSQSTGVAPVPNIDDSSSEQAYQRSCLASLTREKNPEIMALTDAARKDMCTDPRRR